MYAIYVYKVIFSHEMLIFFVDVNVFENTEFWCLYNMFKWLFYEKKKLNACLSIDTFIHLTGSQLFVCIERLTEPLWGYT